MVSEIKVKLSRKTLYIPKSITENLRIKRRRHSSTQLEETKIIIENAQTRLTSHKRAET